MNIATMTAEKWAVTRDQYFADRDHVSSSGIRLFGESRSEYHARRIGLIDDLESDTTALRIGEALHCAWLEAHRFEAEWAFSPDFGDCRFKANKTARDQWRATNGGKKYLSQEDGLVVLSCLNALIGDRHASAILSLPGDAEVPIRWQDQDTGVWCRALLDRPCPEHSILCDLKTIADHPTPENVAKAINDHRYDVQAVHHAAGAEAVYGQSFTWIWLFVGKRPPHLVAPYYLGERTAALAKRTRRRWLEEMVACEATGDWSEPWQKSDDILPAELPEWRLRREENESQTEGRSW